MREDFESDADYITFLEEDTNSLKVHLAELQAGIIEHASQRGDDRCWLDDLKLYKLVLDIKEHPGLKLPEQEFLSNCKRYWQCQQNGVPYKTEGDKHDYSI